MTIQLPGSEKGKQRSPWNVSLENYLLEILEMVRRELREVELPSRICNPVQWWPTAQEMSLWDITEKAGWNWNYWSISTASCQSCNNWNWKALTQNFVFRVIWCNLCSRVARIRKSLKLQVQRLWFQHVGVSHHSLFSVFWIFESCPT